MAGAPIIVIEKAGASFRGAGRYFLHDKAKDRNAPAELKPKTDDRVWFTDTRNIFAKDDPWKSIDEMWATADDQRLLKAQAGLALGGRPCTHPVLTVSMNWHPDEKPTPDQMLEAADKYLKHMGWDDFQALIIGHNDTAHKHLHIMLNRVHPVNGATMDNNNDFKRSQAWRKEYERELQRGERTAADTDRTPANQNKRDLPHNVYDVTRDLHEAFLERERVMAAARDGERSQLKAQQRDERTAFFANGKIIIKELRNEIYQEVRDEYRADWNNHFVEKQRHLDAAQKAAELLTKAALDIAPTDPKGADALIAKRDADYGAVALAFASKAAALREEQLAETRQRQKLAIDALIAIRDQEYKDLLARQQLERDIMRTAHREGHDAAVLITPQHAPYDGYTSNDNRPPPAPPQLPENLRGPAAFPAAAHHATTRGAADPGIPVPLPPPPEKAKAPEPAFRPMETPAPELGPDVHANQLRTGQDPFMAPPGYVMPQERTSVDQYRDKLTGHVASHEARDASQAQEIEAQAMLDAMRIQTIAPFEREERQPDSWLPEDPGLREQSLNPSRSMADAGAGALGKLLSYLGDELAELFAPTPPEVREARAKAEAKREAERPPPPEFPDNPFAKYADAAARRADREAEEKRSRDYWDDRERRRDRDR